MWLQRILRPKTSKVGDTKPRKRGGRAGGISLSSNSIRQLDRLQLTGARILRGENVGERPSHRRKPSSDFYDHRMYVPGDDIRYVDWRASARHENIFIRQGELPKDITIHLLIDTSGSMLWGSPPKKQAQLELAAALGYLALINRDRLRVFPYGEVLNKPLGPISGKNQVSFFINYLDRLSYGEVAGILQAAKDLTRRTSQGGLVFILSDLLDVDDVSLVFELLPAPFWMVNFLHVLHPEELMPSLLGNVEMVDSETGNSANYDVSKSVIEQYRSRLLDWQNRIDMSCVENNAFYTIIPSNWQVSREMIAHLRSTKLVASR
jgi:hypothetical protein